MTGSKWKDHLVLYAAFLAVVVLSSIAASYLEDSVEYLIVRLTGEPGPAINYVAIWVIVVVSLFFVFKKGVEKAGRIIGSTVRVSRPGTQPPFRYLLIGYSPQSKAGIAAAMKELQRLGPDLVTRDSKGYQALFEPGEAGHAAGLQPLRNVWQQNLRAAWVHKATLQEIIVLNPDKDVFNDFKAYLGLALPSVRITRVGLPGNPAQPFRRVSGDDGTYVNPSYEDYAYCYQGLQQGLRSLAAKVPVASLDEQCCVDVTPGYKPFSIAAATLTFNRRLHFSYVTIGGKVIFYDADLTIVGYDLS